jgi:hypothetical protein
MKILWICPFFLHPTDRGAQIRTLGTLKELHKRHEIHFAALNDPRNLKDRNEARSTQADRFPWSTPRPPEVGGDDSPACGKHLQRYADGGLPGILKEGSRKRSMLDCRRGLRFHRLRFSGGSAESEQIELCVLFQHNVETTSGNGTRAEPFPGEEAFLSDAGRKMEAYERKICRRAKHVIAVSEIDAARMKRMFGIESVSSVPTGVDVEYFAPAARLLQPRIWSSAARWIGFPTWMRWSIFSPRCFP